jgi:hypothetical protein
MMITRGRLFSSVITVILLASQLGGEAFAETYTQAWKLKTTSVWPPAVIGDKIVLKNGDTLSARALADGRKVWEKTLEGLRYGSGVLAAGKKYVYVLGGSALYLVEPNTGKVVKKKAVKSPSYVHYARGSVYVVGQRGVLRFDATGTRLINRAKGVTGEICGADGNYVVLYTSSDDAKRLVVVDLKSGKRTYEFKLLPTGWHRVVKVGKGRVVFVDYSKRKSDGTNPKKLYFTEADYIKSKKLKDKALHKRFSATYSTSAADTFWTATNASGIVFIGNHGSDGVGSTMVAYDPGHDKLLWDRSGSVLSMGLLLHKGKLWTGVTDRDGGAHAVAYSPDDGSPLVKLPLDAAGTGRPVAAGKRVLIRTRNAIHCLKPGKQSGGLVVAGGGQKVKGHKARPGWRLFSDKKAGYLIQTPKSWRFNRKKMVLMGGLRMSIPFMRTEKVGGKTQYLGSVHILTWEAAGRDVNTLWNSVYTQRRQSNSDVRVLKVHRVHNVGGTGLSGIKATYTFRSKTGYPIQMRSYCIVSHGVAFELRGWVGPHKREEVWGEVEGIFQSFIPRRMR